MDDVIAGFLIGVAGMAGVISAIMGPIIVRSRRSAPRRLAEAEEKVESGTNLGKAYGALRLLDVEGRDLAFVPRKVRDRARYLKNEIETEYLERIESEVRANLPRSAPVETDVYLSVGRCHVSSQERELALGDLSPTYREHFLAPAEGDEK